ncbi:helix-turn-helix domain-containing protein [Halomonas dongshanensis]
MSRLRQHLGGNPRSPTLLHTVRHQGYRLSVEHVEKL